MDLPPLATLGRRILISGPSNAGKSTLAAALARQLGASAVHLDLLHHHLHTDWQPVPWPQFEASHAAAIAGDDWVMEGNYFRLMPARLERATGIILLGSGRLPGLYRYFRRTLFELERAGGIENGPERINWEMIRIILIDQPRKRGRDRGLLVASGLPMVSLNSMRDLNACYRIWELQRRP